MNEEVNNQRAENNTRGSEGESREGGSDAPRSREPRHSHGDDRARTGPMEVAVSHNIEKAMKILKRKLIKEGLF
jgi:hypothetical protein